MLYFFHHAEYHSSIPCTCVIHLIYNGGSLFAEMKHIFQLQENCCHSRLGEIPLDAGSLSYPTQDTPLLHCTFVLASYQEDLHLTTIDASSHKYIPFKCLMTLCGSLFWLFHLMKKNVAVVTLIYTSNGPTLSGREALLHCHEGALASFVPAGR